MSRALEIARRTERFDEVERSDPVMATVHLAAACAWMATLSIARAPEGIAFGVLMAVAALRAPRTIALYPMLLSSWAFVLFVALAEWQALSALWSAAPGIGVRDWLPRFAFMPLALWPVMHRWRTLAAALVCGAAVHGFIIAAATVVRAQWRPGAASGVLTPDICMTSLALAVAVAALPSRPWPRPWPGAIVRAGAGSAIATALVLLGQRMPAIAAVCGGAVSFLRPSPGQRFRTVAWIVGAAAVLGVAAALMSATPRNRAWMGRAVAMIAGDAGAVTDAQLNEVSGARIPLARLALEVWREHPLCGAGARTYADAARRRFAEDPAEYGIPPAKVARMSTLACAHNAFLDEASERGIVGVGLLVALLAACWWRAWRLDPWSGTAGMLGVWTVACLTQSMTVRGVAVLLLAVIVTRCAFVERDP